MDFYVGQKVVIDCGDADYLENRAVDNGMVGEVIKVEPDRRFPVKVRVDSHIPPV